MDSQAPRLPLEVWEMIIEHCAFLDSVSTDGDPYEDTIVRRAALRACALTCTSWLPTSLRCLYHSLIIFEASASYFPDSQRERDDCQRWGQDVWYFWRMHHKLLEESLPLRPRVVNTKSQNLLDLAIEQETDDLKDLSDSDAHNDSLPLLFRRLGIHAIIFPQFKDHLYPPRSVEFSASIASETPVCRARLCIRALQELHISHTIFAKFSSFFQVLESLPSLRQLYLKKVRVQQSYRLAPLSSHDPDSANRLKLSVFHCHLLKEELYAIMEWMKAYKVLSGKLADLKITHPYTLNELTGVDKAVTECISETIRNAGNSLKYLGISCEEGYDEDNTQLSPPLDLGANQSLQTLKLDIDLSVPTVLLTLSSIRTPRISKLKLKLGDIYPKDWSEVDRLVDALLEFRVLVPFLELRLKISIDKMEADMDVDNEVYRPQWSGQIIIARCKRLKTVYGERLRLECFG